jgi:hypothetical protein
MSTEYTSRTSRHETKTLKALSAHRFLEEEGPKYTSRNKALTGSELKEVIGAFKTQNPGLLLDPLELMLHVPEFGSDAILTFFPPILEIFKEEESRASDPYLKQTYQFYAMMAQKGLNKFAGSETVQ